MTITQSNAQARYEPAKLKKALAISKNDSKKAELLLSLGKYCLYKPGELKADLDSATVFNLKARELSSQLGYKAGIGESILLEGEIYREKGNKKKAWEIANTAVAYFAQNNMPEQKADGYIELARYFSGEVEEDVEQKIKYHELAIPLFEKSGAKEKEATALKDLADFYQIKDEVDKSLALLNKAVAIYKTIHFKEMQGVYNLLCSNYRVKGDFELSLKYGLMAETTAENAGDNSMQLCAIYNHLALTYYDLKNSEKALDYFKKAKDVAIRHNDIPAIINLDQNISSILIRLYKTREALIVLKSLENNSASLNIEGRIRTANMFLMAYIRLKEYHNGKKYYNQLVNYYNTTKVGNTNREYIYQGIILYLLQTGQAEKTYAYLDEFKEFYKKIQNTIRLSQLEGLYFKADSARGDYLSAIEHFKRFKTLSDSIFNKEQRKNINNLQVQFETEKKDKNIKLLTQQSKLQQIKIHNDTITRYVFIGSLIVLVLFLALLYNRYRLKQRSNKKLEYKQQQINEQNDLLKKLLAEKEWLLKEIHHRVKNNLQIVISLLNTQSAYLDNEDALLAIQNSQHRMHAMSLIHQKLYQSENLASIDMSWYIYELINYLRDCFDTDRKVTFELDTEKVDLDVAQAVPLGLILNEAISNAIKYAFPSQKKGLVKISLKKTADTTYQLIIADTGIGLPDDFEFENRDSLGMNLMIGLSDQIDGTFHVENNNGLTIIITFIKNQKLMGSESSPENAQQK